MSEDNVPKAVKPIVYLHETNELDIPFLGIRITNRQLETIKERALSELLRAPGFNVPRAYVSASIDFLYEQGLLRLPKDG